MSHNFEVAQVTKTKFAIVCNGKEYARSSSLKDAETIVDRLNQLKMLEAAGYGVELEEVEDEE